jgi:uncharacterized protein YndB with AHSA1/START domain
MPPLVYAVDIARRPDDVFAYATDPTHFAEWQHDVASVRMHGAGLPSLGCRFTTTRRIGRVKYQTTQEITEFSPPKSFAARSVGGPLRAHATITVEPLEGGTHSRVTFGLEFHGEGVGKVLVPDVVRRIAAKGAPGSYRNLRRRLERDDQRASGSAGATPPASGAG